MDLEKIHVNVSIEHIKNGSQRQCYDCPIAHAIIESISTNKIDEINYYREVSVTDEIRLPNTFKNFTLYNIYIPIEMQIWINNFDKGLEVSPFSFDIEQTDKYPKPPRAKITNLVFNL